MLPQLSNYYTILSLSVCFLFPFFFFFFLGGGGGSDVKTPSQVGEMPVNFANILVTRH